MVDTMDSVDDFGVALNPENKAGGRAAGEWRQSVCPEHHLVLHISSQPLCACVCACMWVCVCVCVWVRVLVRADMSSRQLCVHTCHHISCACAQEWHIPSFQLVKERELNRGASAVVHLYRWLGQLVAVKKLYPQVSQRHRLLFCPSAPSSSLLLFFNFLFLSAPSVEADCGCLARTHQHTDTKKKRKNN